MISTQVIKLELERTWVEMGRKRIAIIALWLRIESRKRVLLTLSSFFVEADPNLALPRGASWRTLLFLVHTFGPRYLFFSCNY